MAESHRNKWRFLALLEKCRQPIYDTEFHMQYNSLISREKNSILCKMWLVFSWLAGSILELRNPPPVSWPDDL